MGRKSQELALKEQEKHVAKPERLFHEINLLHLEGHYFTFDPKAASVSLDPMKSVEERLQNPKINEEQPLEIVPNRDYGKPATFAYKLFQGILKKLSDYGHPVPEAVSFGSREIMRFIGRSSHGGKNSKELIRALHQFKNTEIKCSFYDKQTGSATTLVITLAVRVLYTYQRKGNVSFCTVWLDPLIINNMNNHYTFCLNFARMENLEPISISLYKHLYFHFSNVYSQTHSKGFTYRKDYSELCRTWLGGLKIIKHKSHILKDQPGRHLEALKKTHLIKSYGIEKNVDGDGFNLIFRPGTGFFEDYDRFYNRRMQSELPFALTADENIIQKPQEIVLYFYQKLYGTDSVAEHGFSENETAFATSLLKKHSVEEIKNFIDYGLTEAKKTNFDIKTFGEIKKYYAPYTKYLAARKQATAKEDQERQSQKQEQELNAYDSYRHAELEKIRATLPTGEIEAIENSVRHELEAEHPGSKIFSGWIRQRADRVLAQKYSTLSFEEWQKQCG